jgi:hypothetical protein
MIGWKGAGLFFLDIVGQRECFAASALIDGPVGGFSQPTDHRQDLAEKFTPGAVYCRDFATSPSQSSLVATNLEPYMSGVVTDPPAGMARFRSLLWYAIDVLGPPVSILAFGVLGLVLGQKLQEWLLTEGLKDKSEVMFNVLWVEFKRGFVLKSISLGSAGVLVKATMEFVSLVPTLVTPVWQGFRQRFAFKLVGWDELVVPLITLTLTQWRTLTALSLATASLKVTLMEYRRGRIR